MKWGTPVNGWGSDAFWGIQTGVSSLSACATAQDRILSQIVDQGNFYKLICALAEHHGDLWDVAADVKAGFDLDAAIGEQLNVIGNILDLGRHAFDDETYRKLLTIKGKLVLRSTGTGENILEICRTFIGDAEPLPVVLTNSPPYSFKLTIPGTTAADLEVLIPFIRAALIAAVQGVIIQILPGGALWGSTNVVVTGAGVWGSTNVVVAGASLWSRVVLI